MKTKLKCVYRESYERGGTTFRDIDKNEKLKECSRCDGYNENCIIYTEMRRMMKAPEERITSMEMDEQRRIDYFKSLIRKLKEEK